MQNEAHARLMINEQLAAAGWRLLDGAGGSANVHVEYKTGDGDKSGFADYVLFDAASFPLAIIEAKAPHKHPLVGKEQAREYAESQNIRFIYLSNGKVLFFWDTRRGDPHAVGAFHSSSELEGLASEENPSSGRSRKSSADPVLSRARLPTERVERDYLARSRMGDYDQRGGWKREETRDRFIRENKLCFLRDYQLRAIAAIQKAAGEGKTRFLLEMATGTGKTKTCAAIIKLFLRTGAARRVLFLVDRLELEEQAKKAFVETLVKDALTVVYKENRNDWRKAEIVVSTVQSFLANERYREEFSPADFGLVISDEAHRSISGEARRVFEYFRGFKLGLTATPRDLLRGVWARADGKATEAELERRSFLDTYRVFGCEPGEPTFRYGLLEGVKDGHLVNPTVLDCRTDKTTKLLSEEGFRFVYRDEDGEETEENFRKRDFEKRYFSEGTNEAFVRTFMENALVDPVSGEIGKTLVFCVSQAHAAKITNLLNTEASSRFPGKYASDFARQVTSHVPHAQESTVAFSENVLGGKTAFLPDYDSCKVRACVTVAMMTTGYDCEDVLNVVLMRPVFSPSEFIQMKGRGTRKYDFRWKNPASLVEQAAAKKTFYMFDFFANYEYFEEDYDYEAVKALPVVASPSGEESVGRPPRIGVEDDSPDAMKTADWIEIGLDGMKVDRMFWRDFEAEVKSDADIVQAAAADDWETVLRYMRERLLRVGLSGSAVSGAEIAAERPPEPATTDAFASPDARIAGLQLIRSLVDRADERGLQALFGRLFGRSIRLPTRDELLDAEFARFVARHEPETASIEDLRFFFKSYVGEKRIRDIIDSGRISELNTTALTPDHLRRVGSWKYLAAEIRAEVDLERFGA